MKKSEIRKAYLAKRNSLSKDEVLYFSEKIFKNFVLQFKPIKNHKVHIFLSIEKFNEISTKFFIDYFFEENINVFVPKMAGGKLIAAEFNPETEMETNSWGILEPKTIEDAGIRDFDFVITPLLCCDREGNRVGYGKGFYDKFFTEVSSNTKKIGVSLFPPIDSVEDVSREDIPVDYLITPDEILSFRGLE